MSIQPYVSFRLDAGRIKGVSLGHLFRCLELARELRSIRELDIVFYASGERDACERIERAGFKLRFFESSNEANEALLSSVSKYNSLVIDLHQPSENLLRSLPAERTYIIRESGVEDAFKGAVIDFTLQYQGHKKQATSNPGLRLTGFKHLVISQSFCKLARRREAKKQLEILASFGGSDPADMTMKILSSLSSINIDANLRIVLGPGYPNPAKVTRALESIKCESSVSIAPSCLATEFAAVDLAFLAGGISAYEAAANGLPSLLFPSIEHENAHAHQLERLGCSFYLKDAWKRKSEEIANFIEHRLSEFATNNIILNSLSRAGPIEIDGLGTRRVAEAISRSIQDN